MEFQGPSSASLFCIFGKRWTIHFGMRGPSKWLVGRHEDWYDGPFTWYCFGPLVQMVKESE